MNSFKSANAGFGSAFNNNDSRNANTSFGAPSRLSFVSEPPALNAVSDPNIVIGFKGLGKKDATTKAKALDDLLTIFRGQQNGDGGPEEAVLDAWDRIYPKTSIDVSRRVRQSAHTLQGELATSSGKRYAKHMPQVIGAWLCGLYDTDRGVARAASEALRRVFSSDVKRRSLWRVYFLPLLEYVRDALLHETPQTLSDERIVSPDDMASKYARVVGTNFNLLATLFVENDISDLEKEETYRELVDDKKLFTFAHSEDAYIRRSTYRFLRVCLDRARSYLDSSSERLSSEVVAKSLGHDQSGSSKDYAELLAGLTVAYPTLWSEHYKGRKPAMAQFERRLKKGSQGGSPEYWTSLTRIVGNLPDLLLPADKASNLSLLKSTRAGIQSKEESRAHLNSAWGFYLHFFTRLGNRTSDSDFTELAKESVIPIFLQYVKPDARLQDFDTGPQGLATCISAFSTLEKSNASQDTLLKEEWRSINDQIIQDIKALLPEKAENFETSQKMTSTTAQRWVLLVSKVLGISDLTAKSQQWLRECLVNLLYTATEIVSTREGKPYGAANILKDLLATAADVLFKDEQAVKHSQDFFVNILPGLLDTPSGTILLSCLGPLSSSQLGSSVYEQILKSVGTSLFEQPDSRKKSVKVEKLLSSVKPDQLTSSILRRDLESFLQRSTQLAIQGEEHSWPLIGQMLGGFVSESSLENTLSELMQSLVIEENASNALDGVELLAKRNRQILSAFVQKHPDFLAKLHYIKEGPDDHLGERAEKLALDIQSGSGADEEGAIHDSMSEIIRKGILNAGPDSLTIESLVDLAEDYLKKSPAEYTQNVKKIAAVGSQWLEALHSFTSQPLRPSQAISDILGGTLFLVQGAEKQESSLNVQRDSHGYSVPMRLMTYFTHLGRKISFWEHLERHELVVLWKAIKLTIDIANDNLSISGANGIWDREASESESELLDKISDASNRYLGLGRKLAETGVDEQLKFTKDLFLELKKDIQGRSPQAFASSRALACVVEESNHIISWSDLLDESVSDALKSTQDPESSLYALSILRGFQESLLGRTEANQIVNGLSSDITYLDVDEIDELLIMLIALNLLTSDFESFSAVPQQRIVPFVKALLSFLNGVASTAVLSECATCLSKVLPNISEVYGEHWSGVMSCIEKHTSTKSMDKDLEHHLPVLHSTLRLLSIMSKLHAKNDDADDAWATTKSSIDTNLVQLIRSYPDVSDENHQPLRITNDLLARLSTSISTTAVPDHTELFATLHAPSSAIQGAAFNLLHIRIPELQEQLALDAALGDVKARIPEELLSSLLHCPKAKALESQAWGRTMPLDLRAYLLSWILVYDHFPKSSYKVRSDYVAQLKEGDYLPEFLDLCFGFLGHERAKPISASGLTIDAYEPGSQSDARRDAQWLFIHVYYLSLKHASSLAKAWWINCSRRQLRDSVESWTGKYVAPLVIEQELQTVHDWAENSPEAAEDDMKIKVSFKAREVVASYNVDEQTMQIMIKLPSTYPLSQVSAEGLNRVGVDERKWRSWLINTQGVIMFSNGSIIDGLTAWRKNVTGALKGQTECAICYSIISSDKQLPTKKCNTCKNLFHSSCLYKWFKSSNTSSCPLCRNAFNYG